MTDGSRLCAEIADWIEHHPRDCVSWGEPMRCHCRDVPLLRSALAALQGQQETQRAIAAAVNGYYNQDAPPKELAAFRALRTIADALGKPMEPTP